MPWSKMVKVHDLWPIGGHISGKLYPVCCDSKHGKYATQADWVTES